MNLNTFKRSASTVAVCIGALFGIAGQAHASHIDSLFINITVASSDGLGNFVLRHDMYFGSDGSKWSVANNNWSGFNNQGVNGTYNTSIGLSKLSGVGTVTGSTNVGGLFQGLVDSTGARTSGFGTGQFGTRFVNDLSDAAMYTDFLEFSIAGFDRLVPFSIRVTANDCCNVNGSQGSFTGTLVFNPATVVNAVPEPTSLALLGLALGGLAFSTRRKA